MPDVGGTPPEELARRAQQGAPGCFDVLVERFSGRLYSFLVRRVGSREDAEDLTQETFVRAWSRLETYKPHLRFSTWLFTIAVRLAAAHYRRRRPGVALDGAAGDERAPEAGDRAEEGESRARLWKLAEERLTRDQFAAVWLRYVEDAAVEDIARILGKSRVGVRVTLFRAREKLAGALGSAGVGGQGEFDREPPMPVLKTRAVARVIAARGGEDRERVGEGSPAAVFAAGGPAEV